jgi:hypothetical protein
MQGTKKLDSIISIKLCSDTYWIVTSFIPIEIIIFAFFAYKYLRKEEELKEKCNYEYDVSDLKINF